MFCFSLHNKLCGVGWPHLWLLGVTLQYDTLYHFGIAVPILDVDWLLWHSLHGNLLFLCAIGGYVPPNDFPGNLKNSSWVYLIFELWYHTRDSVWTGRVRSALYRAPGQYLLHHSVSILINIFFLCDCLWGYVRHIISLNSGRKVLLKSLALSWRATAKVFLMLGMLENQTQVMWRSIAEMQNPVSLINKN